MHAEPQVRLHGIAAGARLMTPALAFTLVTLVLVVVLSVFPATTRSMVDIWIRAETFNHCFLVFPIFLWLVWRERAILAGTALRPWWPGLLFVAGAGFVWLLGELGSAIGPSQFAMVAMVPALVLTLFGWGWAKAIAIPLLFLFFAVPFGEVFVPQLIDWTADFTVMALLATGVPVYREGNHFIIPSGAWSVVEACSGIRYLIASFMVGCVYAWLMYRSTARRVGFILVSIITPLVANWLRAYIIVMLGHLSNNRIATGVDHIIYGWIFFGIVMALMFWIGSFWREDPIAGQEPPPPPPLPFDANRPLLAAGAGLALLIVPHVALAGLESLRDTRPVQLQLVAPSGGWTQVDAVASWRPDVHGAARESVQTFQKNGTRVTVFIAVFRNQQQGRELVNSLNQTVEPGNQRWHMVAAGTESFEAAGGPAQARRVLVAGNAGRLETLTWYWLGQESTISDVRGKVDLARDRLLGRSDTSAWVSVSTDAAGGPAARAALRDFVQQMGPSIHAALAATAAR
ncbi:MAG TPA: exosortase A [Burkholderiaceae bacterium]|nr:exosortase A [Burkholderiaceae bacterium]